MISVPIILIFHLPATSRRWPLTWRASDKHGDRMFSGCDRIATGVFITTTPLPLPMEYQYCQRQCRLADNLKLGPRQEFCCHLGCRADGKPVIVHDDVSQLIRAEPSLYITSTPFSCRISEAKGSICTYKYFWHDFHPVFWTLERVSGNICLIFRARLDIAQSSHGSSAATSSNRPLARTRYEARLARRDKS